MNIEQIKEILGGRLSRNADFLYSFVKQINLPKESKVLDVGTGRGSMAIILALNGYKVITGEPEGTNWADWRSSAQKVNVENMITHSLGLADAVEGFRLVAEAGESLKIIIRPQE